MIALKTVMNFKTAPSPRVVGRSSNANLRDVFQNPSNVILIMIAEISQVQPTCFTRIITTHFGVLNFDDVANCLNFFIQGDHLKLCQKFLFISQAIIILMTSEGWQYFRSIRTF